MKYRKLIDYQFDTSDELAMKTYLELIKSVVEDEE